MLTEDEVVDALAETPSALGLVASSQDTFGGVNCVVLEHKDGGEIVWGAADVKWGSFHQRRGRRVCVCNRDDLP